jgi:hypothetical protein
MSHASPCVECDRLAIDYEQTMAEHDDFIAELEAAVNANDPGKISELSRAVKGSQYFCRRSWVRLSAHRASHDERHAA